MQRILTVGIGDEHNRAAIEHARAYDEVFACVGRHPNGAAGFTEDDARAIRELSADDAVVAVGETGLDMFREGAPIDDQRRAFSAQIAIAGESGLPIVIHLRDQEGSTAVLEEAFSTLAHEARESSVILHCFSAGPEWAERAADHGWYCSFAGNATYPKADQIREAARRVPADRILVETDSPFLAPQPMRGKPNQPANVIATVERIAEVRGVSAGQLAADVDRNAIRVFGW